MTIKNLVVHCSASPQGRGDDASTIHRWHLEGGWDGIGYHMVILEDGTMQAGRPEYWKGAHVGDFNSVSLGVCLIGQGGDATQKQMNALRVLIIGWKNKYPNSEVVAHADLDSKKSACPGFNVKDWAKTL
jgi:N-acetylmuramoyl-L-alanine amidase